MLILRLSQHFFSFKLLLSLTPVNVICHVCNFVLKQTAGARETQNGKIKALAVIIKRWVVLYLWWIINTFIFLTVCKDY